MNKREFSKNKLRILFEYVLGHQQTKLLFEKLNVYFPLDVMF